EKANVYVVGFDQLTFSSPNVYNISLNEVILKNIDIFLLPVGATNASGKINITFSDKKNVYLNEGMVRNLPGHCVIYTGTTNPFLTNLANKYDKRLISLFDQDDLAILNSIPTAEGTLQIAMEETDQTIHGSNIIVLGFGRVGKTVARLFSLVGANVHICARKSTALARGIEMGLIPIKMDQFKQSIRPMDICINTIPHR